jgi:hypothetical protein
MRFALDPDHREFFRKNHHIELEGLLEPSDIEPLKQGIDALLQKRLQKLCETKTPRELFLVGRNLYLEDPLLKRIVLHRKFGELASSLFEQKTIRLAYDQAICTKVIPGSVFTHPYSLQQISCFHPLCGGLILRLSSDAHSPTFLPKNIGSGVFFSADYALPLHELFQAPNQTFILIAYAPKSAQYFLEKNDPHTHAPKREGYVFGDLLRTPIIYN